MGPQGSTRSTAEALCGSAAPCSASTVQGWAAHSFISPITFFSLPNRKKKSTEKSKGPKHYVPSIDVSQPVVSHSLELMFSCRPRPKSNQKLPFTLSLVFAQPLKDRVTNRDKKRHIEVRGLQDAFNIIAGHANSSQHSFRR